MATTNVKINTTVTGLGGVKTLSNSGTDGSTPTEVVEGYMLITAIPTGDPVQLDLGGMSVDSFRGVTCVAEVGTIYTSPLSSANVTAACCITAGQAMHFGYGVGTAVPWFIASSATCAISYLAYGIAS